MDSEEADAVTNLEKRRKKQGKQLALRDAPETHRMLPASMEAEQAVLCSALLDPDTIGAGVERGIRPATFHLPAYGELWGHLVAMWELGEKIDIVTLTQRLHDRGRLELVGGALAVSQLFNYLPTAANAPVYADILEEKSILRSLIKVGTEFASRGYEDQHDVPGLLDQFEQAVFSIRQFRKRTSPTIQEVAAIVYDEFQASFDRGGGINGITTGFPALDIQIDGLHASEMIVIAARPSHGKTALMMNIVEHLAIEQRKPVGVFSLEMSTKQLVTRLICSMAKVNWFRWRDGFRTQRDCDALCTAYTAVCQSNIFIDDTSGISIQEARAKARRLKSEQGIEAIFFDYLQLLTSHTERARQNRQQEVSEVSAGLKGIAKDLEIPAVVLAQVDRSVDKQNRKIRLSDLRESGSIEQDADVVAALSREELYAESEDDRREAEGRAELNILKQRSGPLGPIRLIFLKEFTRFETPAEWQDPEFGTQPDLITNDPKASKAKRTNPNKHTP